MKFYRGGRELLRDFGGLCKLLGISAVVSTIGSVSREAQLMLGLGSICYIFISNALPSRVYLQPGFFFREHTTFTGICTIREQRQPKEAHQSSQAIDKAQLKLWIRITILDSDSGTSKEHHVVQIS
jgi:hypothetical protein